MDILLLASIPILLVSPPVRAQDVINGVKVNVGNKKCTCNFDFVLMDDYKINVEDSVATCDKKCTGNARNVEFRTEEGNEYNINMKVIKGKVDLIDVILVPFCFQSPKCREHFNGTRGFCTWNQMFEGADCQKYDEVGGKLCPWFSQGCYCCKSCADLGCSAKGPGWQCTDSAHAEHLPQEACVQDADLCKQTESDGKCYCCKQDYELPTCVDNACKVMEDHMCVDVRGADWAKLDMSYNLSSTAGLDGMCIKENAEQCCKCLKRNICEDLGCTNHWDGLGVCVSVMAENFAEMTQGLDMSAGGIEDLCGGWGDETRCCTCFKKKI